MPLQTAVPTEPDNGRGGGVLLSGKGYSLSGIIFRNNSAAGGGGAGIFAESRGDMDYCVFNENSAALVEGGGIYVQESARTKLSNVTFNKNSALGAGALYVGVFTNKETVVSLNDAIFRNNQAVDGGALFILMAESLMLELENVSFIENKATNGDGGSAAIVGNGNFTISNSEFIGNSASSGNGGHLKLEKCRLTVVNTTFIGSADTNARDAGCHLARSSSTAGTDVTSICGPTGREYNSIYGGAIYLASSGTSVHATRIITTEHLSKFGGAFHVERSATFNLLNSVISGNEAAFGGAFEITQQSTVTIFDSVLSKNLVTADGGCIHSEKSSIFMERCSVTGNTAGSRGGGIFADKRTLLHLGNSTASKNRADGEGGAVYVSQGSEFVSGRSQYLENTAYSGGGALYVSDANKVQIYGSVNFAVKAEYANNEIDSANVEKLKSPCYFSKNKAMSPNGEGGVGGAVCIDRKASIKIAGCIAFKNVAGKAGGFISAKGNLMVKFRMLYC